MSRPRRHARDKGTSIAVPPTPIFTRSVSIFDIQHYASFLIAILVFQAVPGTVAILNTTARNGVRAGFGTVPGTLLGNFIYTTAAVLVGFGLKLAANNR